MRQPLEPTSIPGHSWRTLTPADAPALAHFELVCSRLDGATNLTGEAGWAEKLAAANVSSIAAIDSAGEIAAAGLIEINPGADAERAFLDGRVHPDWRGQGIGAALLDWMEARATETLLAIDSDRPSVLRIMFWDRADDAIVLFEQHGFELHYIEQEMRVDLRQLRPALPLPSDMSVELWSPANAPEFYAVYSDAFSTRIGTLLNAADWTRYWANPDDPEFRPQVSFLVREGAQPAAFCVGHVYEEGVAFIAQFGVRPAWRRRGLGAAVLAEALNRFAANGYGQGALLVNIDNPNAIRLYERAGFHLSKRFTMYRKQVADR